MQVRRLLIALATLAAAALPAAGAQAQDTTQAKILAVTVHYVLANLAHGERVQGVVRIDPRGLSSRQVSLRRAGSEMTVYSPTLPRDTAITASLVRLIPNSVVGELGFPVCDALRRCALQDSVAAEVALGDPARTDDGQFEVFVSVRWVNPQMRTGIAAARYQVLVERTNHGWRVLSARLLWVT